jgi:methylmalonyl-CoA mutase
MHHFTEIAKLRAARMLWAKMVKKFNPKNQKTYILQTHCATSKNSLATKDPFNNIARITAETMAAAFGGTQSVHTNTFDAATAIPTNFAARIARNTQVFLQEETQITKTVDPWAGSYHLEKITEEIANKAWIFLQEIEDLGGMTKAIEKGIPKLQLEEALAKKQTQMILEKEVIIGVNTYPLKQEAPLTIFEVNQEAIRASKVEKLHQLKAYRNQEKVDKSLIDLTNAVTSEEENLLEFAIKAARTRATLTEIITALEIADNQQ